GGDRRLGGDQRRAVAGVHSLGRIEQAGPLVHGGVVGFVLDADIVGDDAARGGGEGGQAGRPPGAEGGVVEAAGCHGERSPGVVLAVVLEGRVLRGAVGRGPRQVGRVPRRHQEER